MYYTHPCVEVEHGLEQCDGSLGRRLLAVGAVQTLHDALQVHRQRVPLEQRRRAQVTDLLLTVCRRSVSE